jgi:hypothetical protein
MSGAAAASNDAETAAVILDTLWQVGLAMRSPEKNAMVAAPFCTTALPLAPSVYNTLPLVMPLVNRIVDRVARNYELLVERIGPSDEFSAKLAEIVREVYISDAPDKPKRYQTMMLGVIRSDYLLDQAAAAAAAAANKSGASGDASDAAVQNGGWKQVEYNTIASSFPALSTRAGLAMQRHHYDAAAKSTVLVSTSEHDIIAALERTHRAFCQRYSEFLRKLNEREAASAAGAAPIKPAIIFVMNPAERNTGDIGTLVRGLQERFGLTVAYKSLEDLDRDLTLDPETGHGIVDLNEEGGKHKKVVASIFYLRSLYREDEYNFPNAWAARLKMERTMAVKCPSVPYHLTTWKTVQALLFSDSKLLDEVLLPGAGNAANRALLRTFMMEHYILAEYKRNAAILPLCKTALQQPGDWILKSMRESYGFISEGEKFQHDLGRFVELVQNGGKQKKGGSSGADPDAAGDSPSNEIVADNMYGQKETVREFAGHHLLVRRIKSAPRAGTFLRNGALVSFADLEDEVSTYGAILTDDSPAALAEGGGFPREIFNHECGYLIRTKSKSQRGGGVMAGVAALAVIALQH